MRDVGGMLGVERVAGGYEEWQEECWGVLGMEDIVGGYVEWQGMSGGCWKWWGMSWVVGSSGGESPSGWVCGSPRAIPRDVRGWGVVNAGGGGQASVQRVEPAAHSSVQQDSSWPSLAWLASPALHWSGTCGSGRHGSYANTDNCVAWARLGWWGMFSMRLRCCQAGPVPWWQDPVQRTKTLCHTKPVLPLWNWLRLAV